MAATTMLLDHNADVNAPGWCDSTPLHLAAMSCHIPTVQKLLESHADLEASDSNGQRPLHVAVVGSFPPCVECLIQAKSDIHAADNQGRSPLALAKEAGNNEAVRLLEKEESILERIHDTLLGKTTAVSTVGEVWPALSCCDARGQC